MPKYVHTVFAHDVNDNGVQKQQMLQGIKDNVSAVKCLPHTLF